MSFQTRVFWGGAKREDMDAAFGLAFPRGSRLLFCWKRAGWEDTHTYREYLWGMWLRPEGDSDAHQIFNGLAQRYGKRQRDTGPMQHLSGWKLRVDPGKNFNPSREIERVAKDYQKHMMPLDVAQGYIYALSRVVELRRQWEGEVFDMAPLPWEKPSEGNGEGVEDITGVKTPNVSVN